MNQSVDNYLAEGCGRCDLYGTPQCKVQTWQNELKLLREMVLACGLTEEYKWSQPCYTHEGKNVLLVTAFKGYATLAFFKGALLKDAHGQLVVPGENSHAVRQLRFTSVDEIKANEALLKTYVFEALEIEKAGLKVPVKKKSDPIPEELEEKLSADPALKMAFEALTPGRQRSYYLHISAAKQSATRSARIEKCMPKIFKGKGFNER